MSSLLNGGDETDRSTETRPESVKLFTLSGVMLALEPFL